MTLSELDSIAPLPDRPRRLRLAVGGALLLLVGAGGMWYARVAGIAPQNRNVSAIAARPSESVGAASSPGEKSPTAVANDRPVLPGDVVPEVREIVPEVTEVVPEVIEVVPEVTEVVPEVTRD
jgi:hypothetical protein